MGQRIQITRRAALVVAAAVILSGPAIAAEPEFFTGIVKKTAVGGYDPVAYFEEGKAVPGKKEITETWKDVTWRFASEKNRDTFKADPEKYAPQYGGYCAWAVSQGYTAKGDPRAWSIVDGKLYLNYDLGVKKTWEKNPKGNIEKADTNWPKVLGN